MNRKLKITLAAAAITAAFAAACFLLSPVKGRAAADSSSPANAASKCGKSVCVPILMYHEVKPTGAGKDAITPWEFESDLEYLRRSGFTTVTMADLINFSKRGVALPAKPVVLSFDDGYYSNYVYVYPLLKKYGARMVLSIIGKNTDDFTEIPSDNINYSHVNWTQLNELISSGLVEVQNHTYDLHSISGGRVGCAKKRSESAEQYAGMLTNDLTRLQDEIKTMTGTVPNTFTYPYGKVSRESVSVIKKLGFQASLTCDYGVNLISSDPETLYGLKRICRVHGVGAEKSISGAMKTLKYRTKK